MAAAILKGGVVPMVVVMAGTSTIEGEADEDGRHPPS
jgi:hypothetical protein